MCAGRIEILAAALSSAGFAQSARSLTGGERSAGSSSATASESQKATRATEIDARVAAARDLMATFSVWRGGPRRFIGGLEG